MTNTNALPNPNAVLAKILDSNQVTTATGTVLPLRDHIPPLECQIIQAWLQAINPRRVLEIGLAYGISALFICDALHWQAETEYHIIDAFQTAQWHAVGWLNLKRAGYAARITLHETLTTHELPRMVADNQRFDLILIDGSHESEQVMFDVTHADSLLAVGGILILDDIQLPAIQAAVAHLQHLGGFDPLPIPAPLNATLPVRVRRLNGVPQSRVVGFRKNADAQP